MTQQTWKLAALALVGACTGTPKTDDSGELPDSSPTTSTDACLFDIGLWCFHEEGGTVPATGTCPVPTAADLMAESDGRWRGRCEDPVHGTLEVVHGPNGYGGASWYFDQSGAFVAYTQGTDTDVFCDYSSLTISFGFEASCETLCLLEGGPGGTGSTGYTPGYFPPPC